MFFDDYILEDAELFDEDYDTDAESFFEDSDYVEEDGTGLLQIALESEISWNNIEKSCMIEEFNAVKNESVQLLEASKDNFFTKAIEWIKEKAKKVINFFKNLIATMKAKSTKNLNEFLDKYGNTLQTIKAPKNKNATVLIYKWKNTEYVKELNSLKDVKAVIPYFADESKGRIDNDTICRHVIGTEFKTAKKDIIDSARNDKKSEMKVTACGITAKEAYEIIRAFQNRVNTFESVKNDYLNALRTAQTAAKSGVSARDIEASKKAKRSVQAGKCACSVVDMVIGTVVTLMNENLVDALVVARAYLKGAKLKERQSTINNRKA